MNAPAPKRTETELSRAVKRIPPVIGTADDGKIDIAVESDGQLRDLYGLKTKDAADGILLNALNSLGVRGKPYRDLLTSMAVEMEPRDAIEAMLINHMTATSVAISIATRHFIHADNFQQTEAHNLSMTRLNRTFCLQVETLKKYRAKAQQTVRVERVTVHEGGQAIVGDVTHGGRAEGGK